MKHDVGIGTIEKRGNSWRIRIALGLDREQGGYQYLTRSCRGNKREAEAYKAELRELVAYAIPSKPEDYTLKNWIAHLETLSANKPSGMAWKDWVAEAEEIERKKKAAKTLQTYSNAWHTYRVDNTDLATSTLKNEETIIRRINTYLGSTLLEDLTPEVIKDAYTKLHADGVSDDGVLRVHKLLKQILNTAYEDELIPKNPITKNRVPTPMKHKKAERVSLPLPKAVELQGVLDEAGDEESEYIAVRLGLNTGLRIGEVCGLTWDNFDVLNGGVLKVRKQMTKYSKVARLKTESSMRNISLDPETIQHLLAWKEHQQQYLAELRLVQTDATPIISNQVGGFYQCEGLRRWFRRFCALNGFGAFYDVETDEEVKPTIYEVDNRGKAGSKRRDGNGHDENGKPYSRMNKKPRRRLHYEGLKFHELRHTQATLLLASGEDIKTVQARLGHAKASTTLDMYAHAMPEKDKEAALLIGNLLSGKQGVVKS